MLHHVHECILLKTHGVATSVGLGSIGVCDQYHHQYPNDRGRFLHGRFTGSRNRGDDLLEHQANSASYSTHFQNSRFEKHKRPSVREFNPMVVKSETTEFSVAFDHLSTQLCKQRNALDPHHPFQHPPWFFAHALV